MLIEKKGTSLNDVVTFRITSGEEIIGKIVGYPVGDAGKSCFKINKPIIVAMQMVSQSEATLKFFPFMAASGDDVTIEFYEHSIVTLPLKAKDDVAKGYLAATSSIAIPTAQQAGLILGS
jgi:hypothetical protein